MKFTIRSMKYLKPEQIFQFFFCVFLFFYLFNGYEFGATVESVFAPAILLLFSSLLVCQNFEIGSYLQAGVLAGLAVASTYFSDIINISQSRIMTFCFCCIMFAVVPGTRVSDNTCRKIISFYIKFSFLLVLLVVAGYLFGFGIDSYGRASINFGEFYKDQNYLSAYFIPAFAISFYGIIYSGKARLQKILYCSLTLFAIFVMGSRGSFLTILLIIVFVVTKMLLKDKNLKRKIVLLVLLFFGAFVLYTGLESLPLFQRMTGFESYGSDVRLRLWTAGLSGFLNHPVVGSGIGAASTYSWEIIGNAVHNSFIELLSDQGISGCLVLLYMYWDIFNTSKGNRFFIFILMISFFVPLFFLTGYSNFTFWMPMFFMKFISRRLKYSYELNLYK